MNNEIILSGAVRKNDLIKIGENIFIVEGCKKGKEGYIATLKPFGPNDLYKVADVETLRKTLAKSDLFSS